MTSSLPQNRILISRTDSIGDVILTLPIALVLKKHYPDAHIGFLGKGYTKAVIEACNAIDEFVLDEDFLTTIPSHWDTIIHVFPRKIVAQRAKQIGIKTRIGTTNRLYHWWTCNKLVSLSRKNSPLHEAQLNLKLLTPLGVNEDYSLSALSTFKLMDAPALPEHFKVLLAADKYNIILHPKSQGSAREWGLANFIQLIRLLDKNKFHILISGTNAERGLLNELFAVIGNDVTDITGKMSLKEFIAFIAHANGLVANSTGPLHIAAALGKDAIGIYPPLRPMHPGRWAPLGTKTKVFVTDKPCSDCSNIPSTCSCMSNIAPASLSAYLEECYNRQSTIAR